MPRILIALLCLGLAAAGCSGSDGDDGASTPTSELPAEDELTQDTVLFDDDADDDAESGDQTDEAEPAGADRGTTAPAGTPSVVIYRNGVLGGWTGSAWDNRSPESADAVGVAAGDEFQIIGIGTDGETAVAGDPALICEPVESFGVITDPELSYEWETGKATVGVNAAWNASPRSATIAGGGAEVYLEQIATLLEQNGVDPGLAVVDQVARVDLEGDGVDEVVLTANRAPNWPFPDVGNYSLVLLRKLIDEQVQTAILFSSYIPEEPENIYWLRAHLSGFADLNGDGKLEILMSSQYYEGDGIEAFEYVNDDLGPVSVLEAGCGA